MSSSESAAPMISNCPDGERMISNCPDGKRRRSRMLSPVWGGVQHGDGSRLAWSFSQGCRNASGASQPRVGQPLGHYPGGLSMVELSFRKIFSLAKFTAVGLAAPALAGEAFVPAQQDGASSLHDAFDPGIRGGPSGAGGPLAGLGSLENDFFNAAKLRFQEIDSVS